MRPWNPEPRWPRWPGGPGGIQNRAAEATLRWTRSSADYLVMLTAPEALQALGGRRSPESANGRGALVAQPVARSIAFFSSGCPRADPPGHRHRRNGLGQPPAQPERCPVRDMALPVLLPRPPRGPLQVQPLRRTRGELLLLSLPPHAKQGCESPLRVTRAHRRAETDSDAAWRPSAPYEWIEVTSSARVASQAAQLCTGRSAAEAQRASTKSVPPANERSRVWRRLLAWLRRRCRRAA